MRSGLLLYHPYPAHCSPNNSVMGRGRKFKGPAQVGAGSAPAKADGQALANGTEASRAKHAGISDALRQAVMDLGGGEDDLDLIDGVDEDDDEPADKSDKVKKQGSEVCCPVSRRG